MSLCLSRSAGERVQLMLPDGREIWVSVVTVRANGSVRLGFDAPGDVDIKREELLARSGHDGPKEGSPGHDVPLAKDGP
ncbi:MAG: carbon storage regulator [Candidatus Fonsibacter sp.]